MHKIRSLFATALLPACLGLAVIAPAPEVALATSGAGTQAVDVVTLSDGSAVAADSVIVTMDAGSDVGDLQSQLDDAGIDAQLEVIAGEGDSEATVLVTYTGEESPDALAEVIEDLPAVDVAEPDAILSVDEGDLTIQDLRIALAYAISDPRASSQWALEAAGFDLAWTYARVEGGITVAVIDTGVDVDHEDLVDNLILGDYAMDTELDEMGTESMDDLNGHGTHVTGIVSAVADNGLGVAGASYNATVLPVKVTIGTTGNMRTSSVIQAIDYIVALKESEDSPEELRNIRIINMSFGASTAYHEGYAAAIQSAEDAGILLVSAAGNSGSALDTYYPASYDGVIGVGSLQSTAAGIVADSSHSNTGDFVDISAPGNAILSTYRTGGYSNLTGTSMATPMVSAAAALVWTVDPSLTADEVADILLDTSIDAGDEGRDDAYGEGMLQANLAVEAALGEDSVPTVSLLDSVEYTGEATDPQIVVTLGGQTLQEGIDYTVAYENNVNVGTATATVVGTGAWTGAKRVTWSITPATLTATYVSQAIAVGEEPALQVEVSGFVGDDSADTASGYVAPSVEVPYDLEPGQSYTLTPEGGVADNYVFDYIAGTLTVEKTVIKTGWYSSDGEPISSPEEGCVYYLDNGTQAIDAEFKWSGAWYYAKSDGSIARNEEVYLTTGGGKWVYYGSDYKMAKGEVKHDGAWYYYDTVTGARFHGVKWLTSSGGKWVYYDVETGRMAKGEAYLSYDSEHTGWYYFDTTTGAMYHGVKWLTSSGGKWVYYDISTGKMRYGEVRLSYDSSHNGWYYFEPGTGKMAHGWKTLPDGRRVYYHAKTGQMQYGWQTIGGVRYYFNTKTGNLEK